MRAGSSPLPTSRSSSSIFSSTDSELASELVPKTARPTFCDSSQRHWRTKRSGSGDRSALKGVTTGDRTPVIRWVSFMPATIPCFGRAWQATAPTMRYHAAMTTLKIDHARYVVTLDPQRRIVQDGAVLIDDGRITRVGKAAELAAVGADRVIDARQMVVTPGFVNGHMHISYAHAVRGIFPDDVGSPLPSVFKLQMAMTEEEEHATSLLGIVELLKNGTVCFVDPGSTKYPDACLQAYQDSGIRVILGDCVTDQPAPFPLPRYSAAECVDRTAAFLKKWHGRLNGRVRAWAMPFSPETCSADLLRALKRLADEHRTCLTLHHGSGNKARQDYQAKGSPSPTQYLEGIGVLGPNVVLAHVLGIDDAEIDAMAR